MLYIDINSKEVKLALTQHETVVKKYITRTRLKTKTLIDNYIRTNLDKLISGTPSELKTLNLNFYNSIGTNYTEATYLEYINVDKDTHFKKRTLQQRKNISNYNKLHKKIERIINYEEWFITSPAQHDYSLAKNLNRNTCTYCNRLYTNTMTSGAKNKKIMRPQFDHWFPKKKHPLLALSFYNLIPSCSVCNSSVKGDLILDLDHHLHPYIDTKSLESFEFSYDTTLNLGEYDIKIVPVTTDLRASKTFEKMFLKEMYNAHQSELHDLIQIKDNYSVNYIDDLITAFPKATLSTPEVYRILFNTEYKEENFHKRPFSKFKSDILKGLGIIKK